ncbi:MAG: alpha-L-fucosidase [Firmicutes bacterium]|nr:alpha-L-fucosidase [Bacillota bacterium]MCM1401911.1 alpha-L-fucosidase [Bacteroides sp.]MCM1477825.1 alpha-L-fucosidase [Bacteroides sp.]
MTLRLYVLALCIGAILQSVNAQGKFSMVQQTLPNPDNEPAEVFPVPHPRQLQWQETEFYAFFHYGMNTYTGLEWGNGGESESLFAPIAAPNPRQWLEAAKAAGMKGGIAVVKHHDGFCLWPTETTTHNCTNSSNEFAKNTNIPRDFADAARDLDMKYGFYISPWDRNSAEYGRDTYVKNVFMKQCEELAKYGSDQFEMWFDGANGGDGYYGGSYGTRSIDRETYYDVPNLRDYVHKICKNCVMWGVGGEARWIGNEDGWAGQTNWSPENRGTAPESNGMYGAEEGWFWLPGESDAKSTSGGWFYHDGQSYTSAERLFQMYLETVGRNATLILNIPPNKAGVLPEQSVKVLADLGKMLTDRLGNDLALTAKAEASNTRTPGQNRNYNASNLIDGKKDTYWATNDGTNTATITLTWDEPQQIRYVELMEHIAKGQRVKGFTIETSEDGSTWTRRAQNIETTTIGYKRIIPLNGSTSSSYTATPYTAKAVRITINDSRACPLLSSISVY